LGAAVGPDLTGIHTKSREQLLTDILLPNAAVDSRFESFTALTHNGLITTGVLVAETDVSVTLRLPGDHRVTYLRSELEELRGNGKSIMPEGFEREISVPAMADLLAFLQQDDPE
jgi:putative heme-binding domain-containing protein